MMSNDQSFSGKDQVAERKQAEDSALLAAIVESTDAAIIGKTLDGFITSWNKGAEDIYGYSAGEVLGKSISIIAPPKCAGEVTTILETVKLGGSVKLYDTVRVRKDGTHIDVALTVSPIKNADGRIVGASTIARDTTERRQAEKAQKRLVAILEATTDFVGTADMEGRLLYHNHAARRMLGVGAGEDVSNLRIADAHPAWAREIVLREGIPTAICDGMWSGETAILSREGRETPVSQVIIAHKLADGTVEFLSTIARDITERKQLVSQLTASVHEAQAATEREQTMREELEVQNEEIQGQHEELQALNEELRVLNEELEARVRERTADLVQANAALRSEITVREQIEADLRYQEQLLRGVIDAAPFGAHLYELQPDGRLVFKGANPSADRILGVRNRQFIGKTIEEAFPALIETEVPDAYRRAAALGEPYETEQLDYDEQGIRGAFEVHAFQTGRNRMASFFRDITERKKAEKALDKSLADLSRTLEETIRAIALTVEIRDPYTAGHQKRVAQLALALAREMGLSAEQIQPINMASLIHDIGKIYVPAELLSKPGRLSDVEFNMIRSHCQIGYDILKTIKFPWPIAEIVYQHHERFDGSGYPSGLSGEGILLEARIIGVADVVEAMASHRPYRPALGIDRALEEVSTKKGVLYDPAVVDACLKVFEKGTFQFA